MKATDIRLGAKIIFEDRQPPAGATPLFANDSDDAIRFLGPVLGPTATLLLRKVVRYVTPRGRTQFESEQLARAFGVGIPQLCNALGRLHSHDLATIGPISGVWYVDVECYRYPQYWIARLPEAEQFIVRQVIAA